MSTDIFYIEILKSNLCQKYRAGGLRRPQMMKTTPKSRFVCKKLHVKCATFSLIPTRTMHTDQPKAPNTGLAGKTGCRSGVFGGILGGDNRIGPLVDRRDHSGDIKAEVVKHFPARSVF